MTSDFYNFSELKPIERYKLLCGIVVPRPIALVTSLDEAGRVNAAPFSFFNVFSEEPAQIVLGLQHKAPSAPKDTTRNLARARSFVVNMVDEAMAETMSLCATDFPAEISETEALGIETARSTLVEPPRIAAAPFALECRKTMSLVFHETRELLIGEVLAIHARADLTDRETLYTDASRYRPIGRLAGNAYCRQGEVFELRRLTYEQWRRETGR
ncbi:MAG: flavin reductase family protein [Hyphomicrobiaceae bacterium]|nr:flavin reductase family protein [Hyphomicrobiaceae bacterium]